MLAIKCGSGCMGAGFREEFRTVGLLLIYSFNSFEMFIYLFFIFRGETVSL